MTDRSSIAINVQPKRWFKANMNDASMRRPFTGGFDILEAFHKLDTATQLSLTDQVFSPIPFAYKNAVRGLWPMASDADARKLEMMLARRLKSLA